MNTVEITTPVLTTPVLIETINKLKAHQCKQDNDIKGLEKEMAILKIEVESLKYQIYSMKRN